MFIKNKLFFTAIAFVLSGCATTSQQYNGQQRSDAEIAKIRRVNVVDRENGKPGLVITNWKIDGKAAKSDQSMNHAWGVLPGKIEIGASLSLVKLLTMTVRQFEGTYWIPFEAVAGKTYQIYAEVKEGDLPLEVCALEVPNEIAPIALVEGMKMPAGVKVAGCGTPKKSIASYELRHCDGMGSCPISDAYLKP